MDVCSAQYGVVVILSGCLQGWLAAPACQHALLFPASVATRNSSEPSLFTGPAVATLTALTLATLLCSSALAHACCAALSTAGVCLLGSQCQLPLLLQCTNNRARPGPPVPTGQQVASVMDHPAVQMVLQCHGNEMRLCRLLEGLHSLHCIMCVQAFVPPTCYIAHAFGVLRFSQSQNPQRIWHSPSTVPSMVVSAVACPSLAAQQCTTLWCNCIATRGPDKPWTCRMSNMLRLHSDRDHHSCKVEQAVQQAEEGKRTVVASEPCHAHAATLPTHNDIHYFFFVVRFQQTLQVSKEFMGKHPG